MIEPNGNVIARGEVLTFTHGEQTHADQRGESLELDREVPENADYVIVDLEAMTWEAIQKDAN